MHCAEDTFDCLHGLSTVVLSMLDPSPVVPHPLKACQCMAVIGPAEDIYQGLRYYCTLRRGPLRLWQSIMMAGTWSRRERMGRFGFGICACSAHGMPTSREPPLTAFTSASEACWLLELRAVYRSCASAPMCYGKSEICKLHSCFRNDFS